MQTSEGKLCRVYLRDSKDDGMARGSITKRSVGCFSEFVVFSESDVEPLRGLKQNTYVT